MPESGFPRFALAMVCGAFFASGMATAEVLRPGVPGWKLVAAAVLLPTFCTLALRVLLDELREWARPRELGGDARRARGQPGPGPR